MMSSVIPAAPIASDSPGEVTIRRMNKRDYDYVVTTVEQWWGGPLIQLAQPVFFYELGRQALVAEDARNRTLAGFLLGFVVSADGGDHVGYVHLVGVTPEYRRRSIGRGLYRVFSDSSMAAGCRRLKAVVAPKNDVALQFHQALGWMAVEDTDYAGPGRRRIVLTREL